MLRSFLLGVILLFSLSAQAQFIIKGKVTDAETGDPIAFANVLIQGTTIGMTTDFEGNYLIESKSLGDSLKVSYLGYLAQSKPLGKQEEQTVNFQLWPTSFELGTFVFEAGENPAF